MNIGYGAVFTDVKPINDNILIKKAKNLIGETKIKKEIQFYKNIQKYNIIFPIPELFDIHESFFYMKYYKNHITLLQYINKNNEIHNQRNNNDIINVINTDINNLHQISKTVSKETYNDNLVLETYQKINDRISDISHVIKKYDFIKKVNNVEILPYDVIMKYIIKYVNQFINSNQDYTYYSIHGDLHLNNILINPDNLNIIYIDPRGYFGNSQFYGMKQYDYAKLYFGLSGYSDFDIKDINTIDINKDNINIDIKPNISNSMYNYDEFNIINIFIICIWLGNAHCFKTNEYKLVESYYYAILLASKFIYIHN